MEVTLNLHVMNQSPNPRHVSFSYARAIRNSELKTWQGCPENVEAGQKSTFDSCKGKLPGKLGKYSAEGESEDAKKGMFVKGYTCQLGKYSGGGGCGCGCGKTMKVVDVEVVVVVVV